jgi:hypothetical protein
MKYERDRKSMINAAKAFYARQSTVPIITYN